MQPVSACSLRLCQNVIPHCPGLRREMERRSGPSPPGAAAADPSVACRGDKTTNDLHRRPLNQFCRRIRYAMDTKGRVVSEATESFFKVLWPIPLLFCTNSAESGPVAAVWSGEGLRVVRLAVRVLRKPACVPHFQ